MRRRARWLAATSAPFTSLYAGLAGVAGAIGSHSTTPLSTDPRAVVVAAHPDDELGCGGIIALHSRAATPVRVIVCTDGSGSRAVPGLASDRASIRRAECEAARHVLGYELTWLGIVETPTVDIEPLAARLTPLLADAQVVYAPSRVDFHPVHRAVAAAVARALPDGVEVRVYALSVPLGRLTNRVADVTTVEPIVHAATAAYATQARTLWCLARQRRYVAAMHGRGRAAEAVWAMSAADYRALHAGPPETWPSAWRSLRPHASTDPLAWWFGRDERARLGHGGAAPG